MAPIMYCPNCGTALHKITWARGKDGQHAYTCALCGYKNYTVEIETANGTSTSPNED